MLHIIGTVKQARTRVAGAVCASVVQFTSAVTFGHVNLSEVSNTGHLNIIRRLDKVDALQGIIGDSAGTPPRFGAIRDGLCLDFTDSCQIRC